MKLYKRIKDKLGKSFKLIYFGLIHLNRQKKVEVSRPFMVDHKKRGQPRVIIIYRKILISDLWYL